LVRRLFMGDGGYSFSALESSIPAPVLFWPPISNFSSIKLIIPVSAFLVMRHVTITVCINLRGWETGLRHVAFYMHCDDSQLFHPSSPWSMCDSNMCACSLAFPLPMYQWNYVTWDTQTRGVTWIRVHVQRMMDTYVTLYANARWHCIPIISLCIHVSVCECVWYLLDVTIDDCMLWDMLRFMHYGNCNESGWIQHVAFLCSAMTCLTQSISLLQCLYVCVSGVHVQMDGDMDLHARRV